MNGISNLMFVLIISLVLIIIMVSINLLIGDKVGGIGAFGLSLF